jgi:WD40 repeat protein
MSDSDDDEMRQLRQSSRFAPTYATTSTNRPIVEPKPQPQRRDEEHDVELEAYRAMGLPLNFGAMNDSSYSSQQQQHHHHHRLEAVEERSDNDDDGEAAVAPIDNNNDAAVDDNDDSSSGSSVDVDSRVPASQSVTLNAHEKKAVSALAIDRAGGRLLSGCYDYSVKFWNFAGMNSEMRSFRSVTPADGYQVTSLDFSFNGALFLVSNTSAQVKLYDRDGFEQKTFARGDGYLFDMKRTTGHVTNVNEARFDYGGQPDQAYTVSADGTLRRWRINNAERTHELCALAKDTKGKKVALLCLSVGESLVATGAESGAVLLWNSKSPMSRPQIVIDAHKPGDDAVTRCSLSPCGKFLLTRSGTDHQMALFDIRLTKKALWRVDNLHVSHATTSCGFAPSRVGMPPEVEETAVVPKDSLLAYTGVGAQPETGTPGGVAIVECATGNRVAMLPLGAPGIGAVSVVWHPTINQIVVGQSDGTVRMFYRPDSSRNGVVSALGRRSKKKHEGAVPMAPIHLPNAHEAFAEPVSRKRQFEKDRQDARLTKRPDVGSKVLNALRDSKAAAHRLGSGGQEVMERLIENGEMMKRSFRAEDPREALLRFSKESGPTLVSQAYAKSQPVPVFDYSAQDDDDDDPDADRDNKLRKK